MSYNTALDAALSELDLVQGLARLYWRGQSSAVGAAARRQLFGNLTSCQFSPNVSVRKQMRSSGGRRRVGRVHETGAEPVFSLTVNSFGDLVRRRLFGHDEAAAPTALAQSSLTTTAGAAWDANSGDDGTAIAQYDVLQVTTTAGVPVRGATAITIVGTEANYGADSDSTTMAAGIDYELDLENGQVLFLKAISDDDAITPTVTIPAITATSEYAQRLYTHSHDYLRTGYWDLFFYDQEDDHSSYRDTVVARFENFRASLVPTQGITFDGQSDAQTQFDLHLLGEGGTLYVRSRHVALV